MSRTIVGVLRGGNTSEYEQSLKTGAAMLAALPEEKYDTRDVFIDKRGFWHLRGMPVSAPRALQQVDVVLNAIHGGMGEDGTVQRFLDSTGIPYAGTGALGASVSFNKMRAHEILEAAGVRMPSYASFSLDDQMNTAQMARSVFSRFGPPYMVKPPREGASNGIRYADSLIMLPDAIGDVLDAYGTALVEQFIQGEHVNAGVIEDFRNDHLYVLPPASQKLPFGARYIENRHHRDNSIQHEVPSRFSHEDKQRIENIARAAHQALGMSHFSHVDMVKARSQIYLLEVDVVPALYEGASFPPMLQSVGSSVGEFLEHAIRLARSGK